MRIIGGALLVTCLLIGTGAAISQTALPRHVATTLEPLTTELGTSFLQLPTALTERSLNVDLQLPTTQLAASATSFPQSINEKVRNLFCRWLGCESDLAATSRISQIDVTKIGNQQRDTRPQNVKQPAPIPQTSPSDVARSATTTTQVVVSTPHSTSASSPAPSITQPVIERTNTIIQSGITEALLDARLLALTNDLNSRMNNVALAGAYQTNRTYDVLCDGA